MKTNGGTRKAGLLKWLAPAALALTLTVSAQDGGGKAAGNYLYHRADAAGAEGRQAEMGGLVVHFPTPSASRLVIAFGWKYRKDRFSREGTTEAQREWFKPFKARLSDGGKTATFPELPPDFYDLLVFDSERMTLHEGVDMLSEENPDLAGNPLLDEITQTLSRPPDRIAGVDAFFDKKEVNRIETDGVRGAALLQQMRTDKAFAESGATIAGCIHSVDVFWLLKGKQEGGWQVLSRQQLYRDELPRKEFFRHEFRKELQGIRIGAQVKDIGTVLGNK